MRRGARAQAGGVLVALLLLALPLKVMRTPLGRRLAAAAFLIALLGSTVSSLYDHAEPIVPAAGAQVASLAATPTAAAHRSASASRPAAARTVKRPAASRPAQPAAGSAAQAAVAWYAAAQGLPASRVRALQQQRLSATQVRVLVIADPGDGRLPSALVTATRRGAGWVAG